MKKIVSRLKSTALLSLSVLSIASYADPFYVISSDSNNCKVHWNDSKKDFVYVTGSDCLCMQEDSDHLPFQWVVNFGDDHTPMGCYPALNNPLAKTISNDHNIRDCQLGDHCTQYECLKLLYYDNTEQSVDKMTVDQSQCVDQHQKPLPLCDKNGSQCH